MAKIFRLSATEEPRNAVLLTNASLREELGSLRGEAWNSRLRSAAPVAIRFAPPTPRHKPRDVTRCDVHVYGDKLIFSVRAFALISRLQTSTHEDFIQLVSADHGRHYCFAPIRIHDCLLTTSTFRSTANLEGKHVPFFLQRPRFAEEAELPAHILQCRHPMIDLRPPEVFVSSDVRDAWLASGLEGAAFDPCG